MTFEQLLDELRRMYVPTRDSTGVFQQRDAAVWTRPGRAVDNMDHNQDVLAAYLQRFLRDA